MDSSRRTERQAAAWLARRDAGPWSAGDQQALDAWLAGDTSHRVAWLRLEAAWTEAARLRALGAGLAAGQVPPRGHWAGWHRAAAPAPGRPSAHGPAAAPPDLRGLAFAARPAQAPARRWPARGFAAVALLVAGLAGHAGWTAWQAAGLREDSYASGHGQVLDVALADGSRAILSSGSRLDVRMERGQRHVALREGEAIFEVAHDPGRPFVVEADGRRAVAVGTRYAVRREPGALRVVVTQGRVRLESAGSDGGARPMALLTAGSLATAGRDGLHVRALPAGQAERLLEWQDGFLAFDDVDLAEAAAEFNRFNTRRLELADPQVAGLRIGGNFRWDNLDGFVGLLEQGFPVRAERHPDRIVLHAR